MNSKYKLLLSNMAVFAIGNILVKLISFFLMPLYTSALTTSQYGTAELLNNTIEIVLPLATLCIIDALYRFTIDENSNYSTLFINSCIIIIAGNTVVAIGCFIVYKVLHYKYAIYFFILFFSTTLYKLTTQFARGLGHVKRYSLYGILNAIILVISNYVMLIVFNGDVESYLLSFSLGYGITGIFALLCSKEYKLIKLSQFRVDCLKDMLSYSIPNIPTMISWWVYSLSDRYILLFFDGAEMAGLYTAGSKFPAMINLVASIFQMAWQYSTAVEIGDKNSKSFFSNVFRLYSYTCIGICAVLILLNRPICRILLQSDFFQAWKFTPMLLLGATFGAIGIFFGTFYNALKNNKMLMLSTIVGGVSNIIINIILIPSMGALGAAIATAISYFAVMIIRMIDVGKKVEICISIKSFSLQCSLLLIIAICGFSYNVITLLIQIIAFIGLVFSDVNIIRFLFNKLRNIFNLKLMK